MKTEYLPKTGLGKLAHLAEECGEVVKVVGKSLRFGLTSFHPDDESKETNGHALLREIADLRLAAAVVEEMLKENGFKLYGDDK